MDQAQVLIFVRLLLHIVGAVMTTLGLTEAGPWSAFTDAVLSVVGPIMNVGALVWTWWASRKAAVVQRVAAMPEVKGVVMEPTQAGTAIANAIPGPTVVPAGTAQAVRLAKDEPVRNVA